MAERPKNILVLWTDQQRPDTIGAYGNPVIRTPNLDRLAATGTLFEAAYCAQPVCSPSRASFLTGLFPHAHGVTENNRALPAGIPTLAERLQPAGYTCGYVGKWHLGGMPRNRFIPPGPERLGFDDFWAAWNCAHTYISPRYHLNDSPEVITAEGRYEPEVQTALFATACVKRTPCAARRSRCGVWTSGLPAQPSAEPRCSSVKRNKRFGREATT